MPDMTVTVGAGPNSLQRTPQDAELVSVAMKRYKMAVDATSSTRNNELDDLRFMAASPDNNWQWPQDVQTARGATNGATINARPMLTINKLPQHVRQVTNDQKQNRPEGKVIPVDDRADPEVADIYNGIIRHIEYMSDADVAYDTANDNQVTYGEGYWQILTDYVDPYSFDQDIKIGRIRNSFSVYMDPTIQDPCGSDANWCLITEDMLKADFEAQYPQATPVSTMLAQGTGDQTQANWFTQNMVKVASYYYTEYENANIMLLNVPELGERTAVEGSREFSVALSMGAQPVMGKDGQPKRRQTQIKRVKWCKINGYEVLERRDWAGKWIPVIRVVGNEWEVDGQLVISGIVRNAKDAQRMYNYWTSQEAEMLALAPKAPFIGYSGQFEGYEDQWKNANIQNYPYLEVNTEAQDHEGRPLPLPQRAQPPMPQAGIFQAKMGAADDIKATTGQYDSSLGRESQEKSGRAIIAREKQADTGTYHYLDNFTKAKRFTVRQLVDLIPKIYDTQRIARIVGVEGEIELIKLNPSQPQAMLKKKDQQTGAVIERIVNLGIGTYDVMASTGPSYMTKRQEFVNSMVELTRANPKMWDIAGDLLIKNMDFPGAQELAARFKRTIPPQLLDDAEDTPEVAMLKQEVQKRDQVIQELQGVMQQMQQSVEVSKQETEEFKADIQAFKAETERMRDFMNAIKPDEIEAVVRKTIAEVMSDPPLEREAPQPQGVM